MWGPSERRQAPGGLCRADKEAEAGLGPEPQALEEQRTELQVRLSGTAAPWPSCEGLSETGPVGASLQVGPWPETQESRQAAWGR